MLLLLLLPPFLILRRVRPVTLRTSLCCRHPLLLQPAQLVLLLPRPLMRPHGLGEKQQLPLTQQTQTWASSKRQSYEEAYINVVQNRSVKPWTTPTNQQWPGHTIAGTVDERLVFK
jgi:hypothetical protein